MTTCLYKRYTTRQTSKKGGFLLGHRNDSLGGLANQEALNSPMNRCTFPASWQHFQLFELFELFQIIDGFLGNLCVESWVARSRILGTCFAPELWLSAALTSPSILHSHDTTLSRPPVRISSTLSRPNNVFVVITRKCPGYQILPS